MIKNRWILGVVVLVVIIAGVIFRKPLVLRIASVRPFVNDRFQGWVNMGLSQDELDRTLRRIHDPKGNGAGSWVFELSNVAGRYEAAAVQAETAGRPKEARQNWKTASIYYFIARFPYLASPAKRTAYGNHIKCYLKYAAYVKPALQVVEIPFAGQSIVGYLRVPEQDGCPVVVVTGGVDTWKSDIDALIEPLLAQGLAVFAFDIPGTGESQWRLSHDNDALFSAVFDYLKTRPEINAERLGLYEISFGGYYAVRLALSHPEVDAAVNVGGPVAYAFTEKHIENLPATMIATIAHAMGLGDAFSLERHKAAIDAFSLDRPGYLQNPQRRPPILSINGADDGLVPIEDLRIISDRGIEQDTWIYPGEGHCAMDVMDDWAAKAALWMKDKLVSAEGSS